MSYFSRLAEQTGLADRRPGFGQRGWPSPMSVSALEIDEVRELPPLSPPLAAEQPRPSSRPEVATPRTTDERPADLPSLDHPAEAQRRPSARTEPIERTEEHSAAPPAPSAAPAPAPETYLPGQRVLETVAAVRAWAAAAPASAVENTTLANNSAAPPAIDAAIPSTPPGDRDWRPIRAEPSAGPVFKPAPDVQNLTLSIGAIELTVEAPQQPAAPAPAPRGPRAADASAEGLSRLLRRHYVNWLGGP